MLFAERRRSCLRKPVFSSRKMTENLFAFLKAFRHISVIQAVRFVPNAVELSEPDPRPDDWFSVTSKVLRASSSMD